MLLTATVGIPPSFRIPQRASYASIHAGAGFQPGVSSPSTPPSTCHPQRTAPPLSAPNRKPPPLRAAPTLPRRFFALVKSPPETTPACARSTHVLSYTYSQLKRRVGFPFN